MRLRSFTNSPPDPSPNQQAPHPPTRSFVPESTVRGGAEAPWPLALPFFLGTCEALLSHGGVMRWAPCTGGDDGRDGKDNADRRRLAAKAGMHTHGAHGYCAAMRECLQLLQVGKGKQLRGQRSGEVVASHHAAGMSTAAFTGGGGAGATCRRGRATARGRKGAGSRKEGTGSQVAL